MSTRHLELADLVKQLRVEHPRPRRRWSELLAEVRSGALAARPQA